MEILVSNQNTGVITLKEITDLIDVQHSKAMLKVEQLAKEPAFGEVSKFDTFNLNNVKIGTYLLNKKQAIAVGARLNNALLAEVYLFSFRLNINNLFSQLLDLLYSLSFHFINFLLVHLCLHLKQHFSLSSLLNLFIVSFH